MEGIDQQREMSLTPFSDSVRRYLAEQPASVFLAGGTSRSPQIKASVQSCFPGMVMVHGDPSLGVVSGLAVAASAFNLPGRSHFSTL